MSRATSLAGTSDEERMGDLVPCPSWCAGHTDDQDGTRSSYTHDSRPRPLDLRLGTVGLDSCQLSITCVERVDWLFREVARTLPLITVDSVDRAPGTADVLQVLGSDSARALAAALIEAAEAIEAASPGRGQP